MADPFSAAAGAVSFISLGIQVCQGLVSYCNAWKSYDRDIGDALERLDGLQRTLETLRDILPKVDEPNLSASPVLQNVSSQILSCDKGLRKLQAALMKFRSAGAPSDVRKSLHNLKQRGLYPLRKKELQELQTTVAGIQANLDSAVLVHGLYVQIQQDKTLAILKDVSLNTSTKVEDVRAQLQLTNHNPNMLSNINEQINRLSETMETTLLHKIEHYGRQVEQLLQVGIPQHNNKVQQIVGIPGHNLAHIHSGMIERPRLLRSVIDEKRQHDRHHISSRPTRQHCMCRLQTSYKYPQTYDSRQPHRRSSSRSLIAVAFSSRRDHHHDCPLYNEYGKEQVLGLNVSYCGAFLAATVKASILMTQGAGGFSISPCLSFSPVVGSDAPAFRILDTKFPRYVYSAKELQDCLDMRIQQLSRLYSERRASPHDTDQGGNTILHKACRIVLEYHAARDAKTFEIYLQFLQRLRDLGIPLNKVNNTGHTCLSELVQHYDRITCEKSLLTWLNLKMQNLGAELPQITRQARWAWQATLSQWIDGPNLVPEFGKYLGMAEAAGCNEISLAVLAHSECDLDREIKRAPHRISEPNLFGQTPLHLCGAWPEGIRILIGANADVDAPDDSGFTPLVYAAFLHVHESMRLLVEANCCLSGSLLECLMWAEDRPSSRDTQVESTVNIAISMLSERRRRLQNLAITSLPQSLIDEFKIVPNRLIDSKVGGVIAILDDIKVPVPQSLRSACRNDGSVYHSHSLNTRRAEILWQTGFRDDLNELNSLGMSPLMNHQWGRTGEGGRLEGYLDLFAWFLSKGANVHQLQRYAFQENKNAEARRNLERWLRRDIKSSVVAVHYLGKHLGGLNLSNELNCYGRFRSKRQLCSLRDRSIQLLKEIWSDPVRDSCHCACSSSGCLAFTHTIKEVIKDVRKQQTLVARERLEGPELVVETMVSNHIYKVAAILNVKYSPELAWLCSDMCRFHAFEKLKLRHTCCVGYNMLIVELADEEDREEIRIEQEEQAERLEELVKEFDDRYKEMGLPFVKFFEEYCRPRMDEVLQEQGEVDEEALRRIGVVLHKDDSGSDRDVRELEEVDDEDTDSHWSEGTDDED